MQTQQTRRSRLRRGLPAALLAAALALAAAAPAARGGEPVTLASLLAVLTDPDTPARLPGQPYESLQASSYNRASVRRDLPGWFADSDGLGFIRTEGAAGQTEWVIMEHDGPGCITKMWTPFFYFGFHERKGPNVRVYLDGETTPVLDDSFIELLTGRGSLQPPFAALTARAGNTYLPIPFAKRCKVSLTAKPFYHIINYRAYAPGTAVTSFRKEQLQTLAPALAAAGKALYAAAPVPAEPTATRSFALAPGGTARSEFPAGPAAVGWFSLRLTPAQAGDTACLRSTVLTVQCDGAQTVWCPVGDFFSCADALHPFHTWQRSVTADGALVCRWPMPYRQTAALALENRGRQSVSVDLGYGLRPWQWDERSLHFHANWRPDELLPGTPFVDWNFIDIRGRGVFVGDAWTVLNPTQGWWGEGDEKIYVDGAWDKGFPTHFGTGTEDYYGWAGGVVPTRQDEFDEPFLANVRIGGVDGNRTRGFNICSRTRVLDAIPFASRLCFDMEVSPGTDQRRPSDFMGYSAVMFWYAQPGATHNRPPQPDAAGRPIMALADLQARAAAVDGVPKPAAARAIGAGGCEFELLKPTAATPGLQAGPQRPAESFNPAQWSGEQHCFIPSKQAGDFVEFTFTEQFAPRTLTLYATTSYDFGVVRISVNGKVAADRVDCYTAAPAVRALELGTHAPVDNHFVIRCELVEPNARARGARTFMGLDSVLFKEVPKP